MELFHTVAFLSLIANSSTTLGQITACRALSVLNGDSEWLQVRRMDQSHPREETGALSITPENIRSIFRHQYDPKHPERYGAKGLSYIDSRGELHVIFWGTGINKTSTEVHHRDVLSDLIGRDAASMESESNALFESGRESDAMTLLDKAAQYRSMSHDLTNIRKQDNVPPEILARVQGFELTAAEVNRGGVSRLQIIYLDVDSSPTSTQVSRSAYLDPARQAKMIQAVQASIDPSVQGYKNSLGILGLAQMQKLQPDNYKKLEKSMSDIGLRIRDLEEARRAR